MPSKKKGRGGGSAKRGRGGNKSQRQQHLNQQQQKNTQQPQQPNNNGRHKTHQNQYLQQRRRLQMQRNARCRLFYLQQHLILNCFNYLDQEGREAAFSVMGWSMESHQRRKQEMQRQRKIMESMKERQEWKKNIFRQVLNVEETRNASVEKVRKNADASLLCKEIEKNMVVSDFAHPDESRGEEEEVVVEDRQKMIEEVLPPLFARVDADTLLARLNTRRLYKRLVHYRREDRRRLAEHLAKYANVDGDGDAVEESIVDMFDGDLKNEETANRIYPKNMTISQMAEKEWDDLMVSHFNHLYIYLEATPCVLYSFCNHFVSGRGEHAKPGYEIAVRSIPDTV